MVLVTVGTVKMNVPLVVLVVVVDQRTTEVDKGLVV